MSTPLGGESPIFSNLSLCIIGNTIASLSSSICLSNPPMLEYSTSGFSSSSIAFTLESNSFGKASRIRYESLLTPTTSLGCNFSISTSPGTGKYIVYLVEVLMMAVMAFSPSSLSLELVLSIISEIVDTK